MRRSVALFCVLLTAAAASAAAQVVPAAVGRQISITAGGMGSLFQPSFQGDWQPVVNPGQNCTSTSVCEPVSNPSSLGLFGVGAYVDVKFTRWIQLEAEGRWMRFNQLTPYWAPAGSGGIYEDNYLIGPRVPLVHVWKASVYGKALIGYGNMGLGAYPGLCSTATCIASGRFTDIAFGGGADIKLTRRITLRAFDAEYQYWPQWSSSSLAPYGVSMGVGYRVF